MGHLADYGWTFDLQVFAGQMQGAAELAASCPKVTFILQHAGMLEDSTAPLVTQWRAGMGRLAACPNVVAKLSGLGTFIHKNDPAHIASVVRQTIEMFLVRFEFSGREIVIEKLWTRYSALIAAYQDALTPLGEAVQRAALHDNAARVYRLD